MKFTYIYFSKEKKFKNKQKTKQKQKQKQNKQTKKPPKQNKKKTGTYFDRMPERMFQTSLLTHFTDYSEARISGPPNVPNLIPLLLFSPYSTSLTI